MAKIPVYSSKNVDIAWGGMSILGLAPDSFIEVAPNSDLTDEEVGADSSLSISMLPDGTGAVTISLSQNSPTNQSLAYVLNIMEETGELVQEDLVINDPSGGSFCKVISAHLKTRPTIGMGSSASGSTRDWTFFAERVIYQPVKEEDTNVPQIIADAIAAAKIFDRYLGK